MSKIVDAIRNAIERSKDTRYRIALGSGVSQAQLSRLVSRERSLSVVTIEQLADYLDLEIIIRPKQRRKGKVTQ